MAIWAVVPAAGTGTRMKSEIPKQYLPLQDSTVLEVTLQRLLSIDAIERVVVALNPREILSPDSHWRQSSLVNHPRISTCAGGATRQSSVLNALATLANTAARKDWVLVHDAVRPCVRPQDIETLIQSLKDHPVGGLLAAPVRDTLKFVIEDSTSASGITSQRVSHTIEREHVWSAFTPQMFRFGLLRQALQAALVMGTEVTDESGAIEALGHDPQLIRGSADNIKITHPDDLRLAELILTGQK